MDTDEQNLLLTGRIISAAGKIESRMAECGAVGNGLREKTESLGSKLPPEAVDLSIYIGNIRNKVAHEDDPQISEDEIQLFDASAQTLLEFLDRLKEPQTPPAPPPAQKPENVSEEPAAEEPFKTHFCAFFPLVHLVFGGELLWRSFRQSWEHLVLLLAELAAAFAVGYSLLHWNFGAWFGAGIAVLVFGWLISLREKLRRSDKSFCGKCALFPLANIISFAVWLWEDFELFFFISAIAVFGCMGGGVYLLLNREWIPAAVCGGISFFISILTGFLTHGGKSE